MQYESLQARLKALSASNSNHKFSLVVSDLGLDTVPEGVAGRVRRLIMSESGTMQVYYVKVLEKGDTYEIIERSLPKKLVVKKDASTIEKEEIDKVKLKVSRSIKLMRGAAIRTKKLARDMLLFWKRVDREQRKSSDNQTPKSRNPPKPGRNEDMDADVNESSLKMGDDKDHIQQRPTGSKKPKKSVHENLEPALNFSSNADYYPQSPYDHGLNDYGDGEQEGMLTHSRSPIS